MQLGETAIFLEESIISEFFEKSERMVNMKKFFQQLTLKLTLPSENFITLTTGLWIIFIFLRIYEFIAVAGSHSLVSHWFVYFLIGIAYDLLFVFTIAALMAVPFLLLSLWHLKISQIFFAILSGFILIMHLGLISYFASTNIPLGADFYGYSWKEINLTVSSSTGINVWTFVPFIVFLGLAAAVFIFSKRI